MIEGPPFRPLFGTSPDHELGTSAFLSPQWPTGPFVVWPEHENYQVFTELL
jgi:hypothetical protein